MNLTEDLITFETAKLANEKGFNIKCEYIYRTEDDRIFALYTDILSDNPVRLTGFIEVQSPTQSLLQKWLRDKHKIFIYCIPNGFIKNSGKGKEVIRWGNNLGIRKNKYSSTYEKALEAGLKEALNLIE